MKAKRVLKIIIYRPHIDEGWFWKKSQGKEWFIGLPCIGVTLQWVHG